MKNTIFTVLAILAMSATTFANNEVKEPKKKDAKESVGMACCKRGRTTPSGENVTIRACVPTTGDAQIDMGKACEKAVKAVTAAIEALDD